MRKITEQAVNALYNNQLFSKDNTTVESGVQWAHMCLHGNRIASLRKDGLLNICNGGWFSNTTKERLNGLPNVSIQQKKGVWYLNGVEWDGKAIDIKL